MPKIQYVVQNRSGISYHRIINPISYLQLGPEWKQELLWFREDEHRIDCDILWYNKFTATEPLFIKGMQAKGMKVVVDVDDLWDLPTWHPHYEPWKEHNQAQTVLEHIKLADIVVCTTMKLQDKVRQYNKNTVVIPNAFPYGYENYRPKENTPVHDKMGFIYVAGSTHLNDVKSIEGKFRRIGSDGYIKDRAEFILAGYEKSYAKQWLTQADLDAKNENFHLKEVPGVWDNMSAIFSHTGSHRILPTTNLDEYIDYYDQADVALIPLVSTEWGSYKSVLKVLEASCKRLPVICSAVEPYIELQDYPGIMWIKSPDDWLTHIRWCIKNPQGVKDVGEKLAEQIWKNYDLKVWNQVREQIIKSLVS